MKVTLFRGINNEEYNLWKQRNFDSLNNLSWWSKNIRVAQLYAIKSIIKIEIDLKEEEQVPFLNGARGQNLEYEGYGQHQNNKDFYSFSKSYLKNNILNIEFLTGLDILPKESDVLNTDLNMKDILFVALHHYDSSIQQKVQPYEHLENASIEEIKSYMNNGYKLINFNQSIQLFKVI